YACCASFAELKSAEAPRREGGSNPSRRGGIMDCFRGACHRARVRATRWLAMTKRAIVARLQIRHEAGQPLNPRRSGVSMKAILCSQYCQPDDLVLADVPDPVAGPGEAVIAIKAAALNFFDILMIQGKYQIKPPFPFSPAAEIAGVVESVGAGVSGLKIGDRVVASCGHNGARG